MSFDAGTDAIDALAGQAAAQGVDNSLGATSTMPSGSTGNSANVTFGTMGEFKAKYPQLYNEFMQAWAQNVCMQMKDQNDQFVQILQDARAEDEGG